MSFPKPRMKIKDTISNKIIISRNHLGSDNDRYICYPRQYILELETNVWIGKVCGPTVSITIGKIKQIMSYNNVDVNKYQFVVIGG